ncbi:MAG: Na+/H+ antiporter NhaA [Hyphomicrobiales bacterium]|nr:Na+/H+ antiporter NhaA [Hyphomicrobiales bacterium]
MATAPQASHQDLIGALVLMAATVAALIFANTGLAGLYKTLLYTPISLDVGGFVLADLAKNWVKNLLMAIFFLYVGLEIKAEFTEGALSDRQRAILPFAGAVGGMAAPAIIFLTLAGSNSAYVSGWAIPSATDIAFAVGVVALLGSRVPPALKAFLLAVAVIDDLGAILIIAIFYTAEISFGALGLAALAVAVLLALNLAGVTRILPYMLAGVALWLCVLKSGVNPTLAGVITALFVPLRDTAGTVHPLHDLVDRLKFSVVFVIMPIFAFANAGVPLGGLGLADIVHPVTSGIALGLLLGKPIGITLLVFVAVKSGFARLPDNSSWAQIAGVAFIAGIGFTMSLFIGVLAFGDGELMNKVRVGVLLGSTLAAIAGALVLVAMAQVPVQRPAPRG